MTDRFKAMVLDQPGDRQVAELRELSLAELPDLPVLVEIEYSTLNYKDGLAISGAAPIARNYPMVAGIDLAGIVVESAAANVAPGDRVLVNGWGLSEAHWGGYSRYARLDPEWLVPIPETFSTRQAMAIGTAGYTAMLCIMALEGRGLTPDSGPVLVTGAAGGVGSVSIALLAHLGYQVTASTGRVDSAGDYLRQLGAGELLPRAELEGEGRPLEREHWAGVVDCVGGAVLTRAISQTCYGGAVAACGLSGGTALASTVLPFILRNVALLGVDSVMAPRELRLRAWQRLASDLDPAALDSATCEEPMDRLPELAQAILAGQTRGRTVIKIA